LRSRWRDRKLRGNDMANARCSCGFTEDEAEDYTIGDHLLEMFAPDDDKGTDGRRHLEVEPGLTCACGLAAATPAQLDAHFLAVFSPDDAIGRDGRKHQRIAATARTPLPARRSGSANPNPSTPDARAYAGDATCAREDRQNASPGIDGDSQAVIDEL
jgi:hypothetical protein